MAQEIIVEARHEDNNQFKQIIALTDSRVGENKAPTVNARDLHRFLRVKTKFSEWIKRRVREYDFVDGVDYIIVPKNGTVEMFEEINYALTVSMAKELSMVERTPKGRQARKYFMECERRYFESIGKGLPSGPTITGTISPSQQQELKELVQAKASAYPDALKRKVFSQIWTRLQRKFKVPRYEELPVAVFGEARDYVIAMQIRSVAAPALEGSEPKALPPARRRNTLDDYKAMYRELPDSPQHWLRLITETFHATEALGSKLDAIKAEATKPFRAGRTSDVSSYFDASMSPMFDLFSIADEQLRLTYRCVYHALEGCRNTWLLLNKG